MCVCYLFIGIIFNTCSNWINLFCHRLCLHLAGWNIMWSSTAPLANKDYKLLQLISYHVLQVLNQDETPLLYSLVFGEGVVNDATAVVLFNAIHSFDLNNIDSTIGLKLMGNFFYLFITSTLLGVLVSLSLFMPHLASLRRMLNTCTHTQAHLWFACEVELQ